MRWLFTHFMIRFSCLVPELVSAMCKEFFQGCGTKCAVFLQILRWNLRAVCADCRRAKREPFRIKD